VPSGHSASTNHWLSMSFFSSRGLNMGLGYFFAIAANMPASEARAIDIRQGIEVADGDMFNDVSRGKQISRPCRQLAGTVRNQAARSTCSGADCSVVTPTKTTLPFPSFTRMRQPGRSMVQPIWLTLSSTAARSGKRASSICFAEAVSAPATSPSLKRTGSSRSPKSGPRWRRGPSKSTAERWRVGKTAPISRTVREP
jgi:hypothetical protein